MHYLWFFLLLRAEANGSLDGGGVRGVSSLLILHDIMAKIKERHGLAEIPKPCEFFHMIGGTSTGGLIAIMLGRLRMSTEEALQEYDLCSGKIFSSSNKKWTNATEKFKATTLERIIKEIVARRGLGEMMRDPENPPKGKTFVCTVSEREIAVPRLICSFPRDDSWDEDFEIWEAARATTAASRFFKHMKLKSGSKDEGFIDAAIGCNNPIEQLLSEAVRTLGTGRRLGCIVSIGTGTRAIEMQRASTGLRSITGFLPILKGTVMTLKNTATDGEARALAIQSRLAGFSGAFVRFVVPRAAEKVGLAEYEKIQTLKDMTAEYIDTVASSINETADALEKDNLEHGLTLGLIFDLDKDQLVLSTKRAQPMGRASRHFTGRADIVSRICSFFSPRGPGGGSQREFLLYGMGGAGKSEIALKVAEMLTDQHVLPPPLSYSCLRFKLRNIFFVHGTEEVTINQSYAEIARDLNLLGAPDADTQRKLVLQALAESDEDWLMIFDNCAVENPDRYIPRAKGNILYTARSKEKLLDLADECAQKVDPLEEPDAIKLLLTASGVAASHELSDEKRSALALEIVNELGRLPLAIAQVAAHIRETKCRLENFPEEYRAKKKRILSQKFKGASREDRAVFATFEMSYSAIAAIKRREGRTAKGITADMALRALDLMCFCHYDRIHVIFPTFALAEWELWSTPRSLVKILTGGALTSERDFFVGPPSDFANIVSIVEAVRLLEKYSLLKKASTASESLVTMHVLVHDWIRSRMDPKRERERALIALVTVLESIPISRSDVLHGSTLDTYFLQTVLPHALEVQKHYRIEDIRDEEYVGRLHLKFGYLLRSEKKFGRAEEEYLKAIRILKYELGGYHGHVAFCLRHLAELYLEMGRLGEAELAALEALDRAWIGTLAETTSDSREDESRQQHVAPEESIVSSDGPSSKGKGKDVGVDSRSHEQQLPDETTPKGLVGKGNDQGINRPHEEEMLKGAPLEGSSRESEPCVDSLDGEEELLPPQDGIREAQDSLLYFDFLMAVSDIEEAISRIYWEQDRFGASRKLLACALRRRKKFLKPAHLAIRRLEDELKSIDNPWDHQYWSRRYAEIEQSDPESRAKHYNSLHARAFMEYCAASQQKFAKTHNIPFNEEQYIISSMHYRFMHKSYTNVVGAYDRETLRAMRRRALFYLDHDVGDEAEEIARDCYERALKAYGESHRETIESLYT
ncbi:hypothetical protein B0H63DRAFT_401255, partial [Podospora didyma]